MLFCKFIHFNLIGIKLIKFIANALFIVLNIKIKKKKKLKLTKLNFLLKLVIKSKTLCGLLLLVSLINPDVDARVRKPRH